MDFAMTGVDFKYNFIVRKPDFEPVNFNALTAFSPEVWISHAIFDIFGTIVLWITTKMDLKDSYFLLYAIFCSQNQPNIPKNPAGMITIYILFLYSFLMLQIFNSYYCALLSTREIILPFRTVEEFINKKSHSLIVHPGMPLYTEIQVWQKKKLKKSREVNINKQSLIWTFGIVGSIT